MYYYTGKLRSRGRQAVLIVSEFNFACAACAVYARVSHNMSVGARYRIVLRYPPNSMRHFFGNKSPPSQEAYLSRLLKIYFCYGNYLSPNLYCTGIHVLSTLTEFSWSNDPALLESYYFLGDVLSLTSRMSVGSERYPVKDDSRPQFVVGIALVYNRRDSICIPDAVRILTVPIYVISQYSG